MNEIQNTALSSTIQSKSAGAGLAFYIATLWQTIVLVGALASLLYLVWGGLDWLMAGGDKVKIQGAQAKITGGMVGLAILVGSFAIVFFIQSILKINILAPVFPNNS